MPSFVMGLVGISWNITNVPHNGLTDITFPISIAKAPHGTGYFFAQQFNFIGQQDVGYTGLQPRPNSRGKPIIHAVFSSFIEGSTPSDTNCSDGAEGGPGVTCSVEFSAPYSNSFKLVIRNIEGTTWTGTVVDPAGERVHIGTYTLPGGTQGIAKNQAGFIEYSPWNSGSHTCGSLPYTSVVFGAPTASTKGIGALSSASEDGDCVGKVAYKSHRMARGLRLVLGSEGLVTWGAYVRTHSFVFVHYISFTVKSYCI